MSWHATGIMKTSDLDSAMPWLVRTAKTASSVPLTLWARTESVTVSTDDSTVQLVCEVYELNNCTRNTELLFSGL